MRLARIFEMNLPEIACRTRQEVWKWWDRVAVDRLNGGFGARPSRNGHDAALTAIGRRLQNGSAGSAPADERAGEDHPAARFFAGAESRNTPWLLESAVPGETRRLLDAAERLHGMRFDLLGYRGLSFGDPIDWHFDPIAGKRAPFAHWSKIDPLDAASLGDSKVIWELNRHQWFVRLGQAYVVTGEERHARLFAENFTDWLDANPPGMGINWASSLEAAMRIIAWSWALFLFRRSPLLNDGLVTALVEGVRAQAAHVERYLSYYFAPNTHLTGEALGLFYAGTLFPELAAACRWRELGERILLDEIERQVHPDGVDFEQATCYQRYTIEIYLHYLVLAERNGLEVPPVVRERIQKAIDFLIAVRRPDGSVPQIGDADGGWLLPLAERRPDDLRGLFALAAATFGRRDYAWAAAGAAPELLWLLGEPGLEAFQALSPAPPEGPPSKLFFKGGYAVMRDGWEGDHHVIFDFGPLGSPPNAGHGHADLLSVQCSVFGEPFLVDPGTYGYTGEWRDFFRGTMAHSCVLVDGLGQAEPAGPFHWRSLPAARLRRWFQSAVYDLADAEHDAYSRLPDPVRHRRRVVFLKPRCCWIVIDELYGKDEHGFDLQFQFAPIAVSLESEGWARARGTKGSGLLVKAFSREPLKADLLCGSLAPICGWFSCDYGSREPAPLLRYSACSRLPLTVVTVLLPVKDPSAPLPELLVIGDDTFFPREVAFEGGKRILFLDDRIVIEDS
jgi:hypothetical protein